MQIKEQELKNRKSEKVKNKWIKVNGGRSVCEKRQNEVKKGNRKNHIITFIDYSLPGIKDEWTEENTDKRHRMRK